MLNKKLCVNNNIIPVNNVIPSEDNNIFVEKLNTTDNITITYVKYNGYQGRISSITYNILGTMELLNDLSTE